MKTTSLKEVIGSLLRDTNGSIDAGWYSDLVEWIFEGMRELETKYQLIDKSVDLTVVGHIANLPLDFYRLNAVEDFNGRRLRYGSMTADVTQTLNDTDPKAGTTIYQTYGYIAPYSDDEVFLEEIHRIGYDKHFYQLELDKIKLSFPEGDIKLHYMAYALDADGLPLIPDVQEYKQALKWYLLMKLIGAGYTHPVFDYKYVREEWLIYAQRAINAMSSISVDRAERMLHSVNRLVYPYHGWSDYFANLEQPQTISTHLNNSTYNNYAI